MLIVNRLNTKTRAAPMLVIPVIVMAMGAMGRSVQIPAETKPSTPGEQAEVERAEKTGPASALSPAGRGQREGGGREVSP